MGFIVFVLIDTDIPKLITNMKRVLSFMAAGAAMLLAAASCQVAEPDSAVQSDTQGVTVTFTAGLENDGAILLDGEEYYPGTKTVRVGTAVHWSPSDAVSIFYGDDNGVGGGQKFVNRAKEVSKYAQFQGNISVITAGPESGLSSYSFWGVYPYSVNTRCDGESVSFYLSDMQKSAEESFSDGQFPTVANSLGLALSFMNPCCGYKFMVETEGITKVEFTTGDDSRPLAGRVNVSMVKGEPKINSIDKTSASNSVTVRPMGDSSFKPGVYYYAVMVPGNFKDGIDMIFHYLDGHIRVYHCCTSDDNKEYPSARGRFKVMDDKDHGLTWTPLDKAARLPSGSLFRSFLTENCGVPESEGYIDASAISFEVNVASPAGTRMEESATGRVIGVSYDSQGVIHVQTSATAFLADKSSAYMFSYMDVDKIQGLENIDFSLTQDLKSLFDGCRYLLTLDLSSMCTRSATTMSSMFNGCKSMTSIDLSGFDAGKVSDVSKMFYGCEDLREIRFSPGFSFSSKAQCSKMFGDPATGNTMTGYQDRDNDDIYTTIYCSQEQKQALTTYAFTSESLKYYRLIVPVSD